MLERLRTERVRHWAIVVMWTMVIAAGVATAVVLLGGCGARTAEAQTPPAPDLTAELISSTAALLEAQNAALERSLKAREDAVTAREAAHEDLVETLTKRTSDLQKLQIELAEVRNCQRLRRDMFKAMRDASFVTNQYQAATNHPDGLSLAMRLGLRARIIRMMDPEQNQDGARQELFDRLASSVGVCQ